MIAVNLHFPMQGTGAVGGDPHNHTRGAAGRIRHRLVLFGSPLVNALWLHKLAPRAVQMPTGRGIQSYIEARAELRAGLEPPVRLLIQTRAHFDLEGSPSSADGSIEPERDGAGRLV